MNEIIVKNEDGSLQVSKQIIAEIKTNEENIKAYKEKDKKFKEQLKLAMEEYGVEKITSDELTVSYVAEHETVRLDSKAVKENYPRIYDECTKISDVKSSVRVKLK